MDWMWCYENPKEAAAEIERLRASKQPNGAVDDIAAERLRQRKELGWTLSHDDAHRDGSLAAAAACYAFYASMREDAREQHEDLDNREGYVSLLRFLWPESWLRQYWKPKDRRTDLIRAGALIVAEVERLDRIDTKKLRRAG